jgi:serine/threonine protein kinase
MIVMEFCHLGSLESYVLEKGVLSEPSAVYLFQQLLFGVNYLHLKRIVHRDLKPANVLLQSGDEDRSRPHLKITDFNSAKQIGSGPGASIMLSERGTQAFSAPELRFGRFWNERVDIWASGMCFYYMLHAEAPFNISAKGNANLLRSGRLPDLAWGDVSSLAKNATLQCLTVEMRDRPAAMELMLHPLFYGSDPRANSQDVADKHLEDRRKDDMQSRYDSAHIASCGILSVVINQDRKILSSIAGAEGIYALEGPSALLLGSHVSKMSSSCWKESRNHLDSLQRLAQLRYERSLAESEQHELGAYSNMQAERKSEGGKLTSFCSVSTCSPDSPVSPGSVILKRRGRPPKTKGSVDKTRWFSTHAAVNANPESEDSEVSENLPLSEATRLVSM